MLAQRFFLSLLSVFPSHPPIPSAPVSVIHQLPWSSQGRLWVHWRWAAPKFLRQTLVEWAGQTVPRCAWAKEYYRRQKSAGKGHHAILRALAFKWVRILWRCWHDDVPYADARYLAALAKRRLPSATPA